MSERAVPAADQTHIAAWAASGAMALTGRVGQRPLGPPEPLVRRLGEIGRHLACASADIGHAVALDPLEALGWRAALTGSSRAGDVSCGGSARLLPAADGWIALSLPRSSDIDLVPAWLQTEPVPPDDPWPATAALAASRTTSELVDRASLVGLAVGALGETTCAASSHRPFAPLPAEAELFGPAPRTTDLDGLVVIDLTSLWAGPLCGQLLARAGADVIKVESIRRPDGARSGPVAFYDLLNSGKRSVALDFGEPEGQRILRRLVECSDVVLESSRPRALEQLGIVSADVLGSGSGPRVWTSITGHGRRPETAIRIGFGDDAAVAGGLVTWDDAGPCFCADAVADPATGLVAATATLAALSDGGRWLVDVALAGVSAHLAGPTVPVAEGTQAVDPIAPAPTGSASALGAETAAVLELCGVAS